MLRCMVVSICSKKVISLVDELTHQVVFLSLVQIPSILFPILFQLKVKSCYGIVVLVIQGPVHFADSSLEFKFCYSKKLSKTVTSNFFITVKNSHKVTSQLELKTRISELNGPQILDTLKSCFRICLSIKIPIFTNVKFVSLQNM